MNFTILKTELEGVHPVTGTYSIDNIIATQEMNTRNITIIRDNMTGSEVMDATDPTEYNSLTAAQKDQWLALCAVDNIDPGTGKLGVAIVTDIFPPGSITLNNLQLARQRTISRAEQLGLGLVRVGDVEVARSLP